mmetsp:Transcript_3768/g.23758  ORF Transcript_3768/g.23758 Transcript_3768/m.23758 type:complete len:220 (-) Transcript_3768:542-1201(-)
MRRRARDWRRCDASIPRARERMEAWRRTRSRGARGSVENGRNGSVHRGKKHGWSCGWTVRAATRRTSQPWKWMDARSRVMHAPSNSHVSWRSAAANVRPGEGARPYGASAILGPWTVGGPFGSFMEINTKDREDGSFSGIQGMYQGRILVQAGGVGHGWAIRCSGHTVPRAPHEANMLRHEVQMQVRGRQRSVCKIHAAKKRFRVGPCLQVQTNLPSTA